MSFWWLDQQVVTNEDYLRYNELDRKEKSEAYYLEMFHQQQFTKYDDFDYTDRYSMLLTTNKFIKEESEEVLFNRLESIGRNYYNRTSTEQLEQYEQPYVQFELNLNNKQLITIIQRQESTIFGIAAEALSSVGGLYKSLHGLLSLFLGFLLMPYITLKETEGKL